MVLGGLTRDCVIELARDKGIAVHERPWRIPRSAGECVLPGGRWNRILSGSGHARWSRSRASGCFRRGEECR